MVYSILNNAQNVTRGEMKSHCIHGHEYTEKNTIWLDGGTRYRCKQCHNERCLKYQQQRYHSDEAWREERKAYQRQWWRDNKEDLR